MGIDLFCLLQDSRLVYKHFATLYFVLVFNSSENELAMLDLIQGTFKIICDGLVTTRVVLCTTLLGQSFSISCTTVSLSSKEYFLCKYYLHAYKASIRTLVLLGTSSFKLDGILLCFGIL